MDFLQRAANISQEFSEYVAALAESDLTFQGEHPIQHSRDNHVHLMRLERLAQRHPQITLQVKAQSVEYVFERWQTRLRSHHPYAQQGYRLFLYEDFAPTISVVAETRYGFPYSRQPIFVDSPLELFRVYEGYDWDSFYEPNDSVAVLAAAEQAQGSIGLRVAQSLGIGVGQLRQDIENLELSEEVNRIRKKFQRRPARFRTAERLASSFKIFERHLSPRY